MSDQPDQTWTDPGAFEVGPGVHRIPLPLPDDGLRAVNVYAIADGDRVVLIDSGWALQDSRDLLAKALAGIGYGLADVSRFLVTHVHRDHYSQAVTLRRDFGGRIALGQDERTSLEAILAASSAGRAVHSVEHLVRAGATALAAAFAAAVQANTETPGADWELPDSWLSGGTEIALSTRTLRVIATPGHTRGHVVFYDHAAGALFAGDHVLPHITPSIGFEFPVSASPLGDYLASLHLVRSMPDVRLLPAHGPLAPSVHARVDELLDHHEQRLTAMATAVDRGADTAFEVARVVRWTRRERRLDDLDLFNQVLAVSETLWHLEVLVARGWCTVAIGDDGVAHYRQV